MLLNHYDIIVISLMRQTKFPQNRSLKQLYWTHNLMVAKSREIALSMNYKYLGLDVCFEVVLPTFNLTQFLVKKNILNLIVFNILEFS